MTKESEHNKKIVEAINLAWSSLDSHLSDTVSQKGLTRRQKQLIGGRRFHVACVKEYAVIIKTLSELLK